jgi:hypothetical protein
MRKQWIVKLGRPEYESDHINTSSNAVSSQVVSLVDRVELLGISQPLEHMVDKTDSIHRHDGFHNLEHMFIFIQ